MNKTRRALVQSCIDKIDDCISNIEIAKDEEQDYLDNMPENLLSSERASKAETNIENMEAALDDLASAIENLEGAVDT